MSAPSAADLRRAIRAIHRRATPTGRRYGRELRHAIVGHAVAARSRGQSLRATARALGLGYHALLTWWHARGTEFRPVRIEPEVKPASGELRLVTALGHRVEGLRREDVAFLLRALDA